MVVKQVIIYVSQHNDQYMVSTITIILSSAIKKIIRTDKYVHTHTVQMKSGMLVPKMVIYNEQRTS